MNVPPDIVRAQDIPENFSSTLGPQPQVLSVIAAILPGLDLSDPAWGILDGQDFSIEFNIGCSDPVDTIMLHVRGGEAAIDPIRHICEHTGWRALDLNIGDFINFSGDPAAGLQKWRDHRDRLAASLQAEGKVVVKDIRVCGKRLDMIAMEDPKRRKWWQFWK